MKNYNLFILFIITLITFYPLDVKITNTRKQLIIRVQQATLQSCQATV